VHARPNWPSWLEAPPAAELLEGAVPSASGVDGVLAPVPEKHLLVVAAHAWTHGASRLRDLLTSPFRRGRRAEVGRLAQAQLGRLWRTTAAADALRRAAAARPRLGEEPGRGPCTCARAAHRSVALLVRFPPGLAARATFDELREDVTPEPGESWSAKVGRSRRAVRNAFVRRSEHDRGST
jgi:hypothetical protein